MAEDPLTLAQARLREREELYRNVVELSSLIPWTADGSGSIATVGERWRDWTGSAPETALGVGWLDFLHPDDIAPTIEIWNEAVANGDRADVEYRLRDSAGGYRWCQARATRKPDQHRADSLWYGTLEDVHEKRTAWDAYRRIQGELAHVSRLSAMGAMASAIAHDLNQPLTALVQYIRGCRNLMRELEGESKADVAAALDDADRCAVRAGDIVRRVREFVMRGHVEVQAEPLDTLVEQACRFALTDARQRGIAWLFAANAPCLVLVDRVQIQQVLVNLIRNAVEAMDGQERRTLTIATRSMDAEWCEVVVTDTGRGLDGEAAERMFDPFYTTRTDGMGMGLSISRMIVEAHGGVITTRSAPGTGTTICFTLPKAARPFASVAAAAE